MSGFAVRNDGEPGWRSVSNITELFTYEVFSEVEPPATVPPPPSANELSVEAKAARDKLLAVAANRMGPLQDAVDIGRATDADVDRLNLWKGYRVDLNQIEEQAGFPHEILWPLSPDESPAPTETPAETPHA